MDALRLKIDKQKQKIKKKEDLYTQKVNKMEEQKVREVDQQGQKSRMVGQHYSTTKLL